MERVAQVWVNIPTRSINKAFSYTIPEHLSYVDVGWRVLVPFGSRKVEGFVVETSVNSVNKEDSAKLKLILNVLDNEAWFDENMLQTARWMVKYYLCTLTEAMRLFIPGKSGIKTETVYSLPATLDLREIAAILPFKDREYQQICLYVAEHGICTLSQLEGKFGADTAKILRYLVNNKLIAKNTTTQKTAKPKYQTVIELVVDNNAAAGFAATLGSKPSQRRLLSALLAKGCLSYEELDSLNISKDTAKKLINAGIAVTAKRQVLRNSYAGKNNGKCSGIQLMPEQQQALSAITQAVQKKNHQSFLLHGITGSGKTQVYIEAVAAARNNGRQAIVLVPEIALTGQIVLRFQARFGDDVVVIHSKLSVNERHDALQRLRNNQAGIVIGARSAVFAPARDIGIIIIDEEHEFSYKQEETPRYHTKTVALTRATLARAVVVLGSATPLVETYYEALNRKHTLLNMPRRIDNSFLPDVAIVDMREELQQGRRNVISRPLQQLLADTISRGEQAIVLLNRRGYATFVLCRECGHIMRCRHCSVSLVYHAKGNTLRCHYCQASEPAPDICPACGSRYIRYFGTGTQKVEEELVKLLPNVRVVRMDQDTTGGKMAHTKILTDFAQGKYDILLGTQMVAKGHDIKNVTAVGIIAADSALNMPDFRAAERTFALLTQAAGRAGRGEKRGMVVVQTYNPEHYSIQAGSTHDYQAFFHTEITYRKELDYPPFTQIIKLTFQAVDESQARRQAENTAMLLRQEFVNFVKTEIIGPFPTSIAKVNDQFRLNILIKTNDCNKVKQCLVNQGISMRSDVIIDVDPLSVM